jgi:hypothetical protein
MEAATMGSEFYPTPSASPGSEGLARQDLSCGEMALPRMGHVLVVVEDGRASDSKTSAPKS